MIIDRKFHPSLPANFPNIWKFIQSAKPRARRFVISDEVVEQIGLLLHDHPEVFMRNLQFALPPYDTCYIEFNSSVFFDAIKTPLIGSIETRDTTVGYLIDKNKVAVFAETENPDLPKSQHIGFTPQLWSLDGSGTHSGFYQMPPLPIDKKLTVAFGTTYQKCLEVMPDELRIELDRRIRLFVDRSCDFREFRQTLPHFVGEMRNLFAMLLWINQPSMTEFETIPARRVLIRGRPTVYAQHNIVRLRKGTTIKKMVSIFNERAPSRRHEVRGHWRHFRLSPNCVHDWTVLPDDEGHWHCKTCDGTRTWVQEHLRGDAARGFVTKEYTVTK